MTSCSGLKIFDTYLGFKNNVTESVLHLQGAFFYEVKNARYSGNYVPVTAGEDICIWDGDNRRRHPVYGPAS